jgi:hypothetical protein
MTARGWAIKDGEGINVRTVQDSRIGAMVNWLAVGAGINVMRGTSDEMVEEVFYHYAAAAGVKLIAVTIQEAL